MHARRIEAPIDSLTVRAFVVPTEQQPFESDGTLKWSSTTMVLVQARACGVTGTGYTYADKAALEIVDNILREQVVGGDAFDVAAITGACTAKIRNNGRSGVTAMAVSAVDVALWDLKARLLDLPLCSLLGRARKTVPVYGSGGFTSYDRAQLCGQLEQWVRDMEIPRVKMKVGSAPKEDPERVAAARNAIGEHAALFVDANGAYSVKEALALAQAFASQGVTWFEEPVYHNDLQGNAAVAAAAPPGMDVSNGEYGYAPYEFKQILDARAADVLQADVTRCGGVTGFLAADALCEAYNIPLSSHCAPYLTLHVAAAAKQLRHIEYFHDHVRIEKLFFDGADDPVKGALVPDLTRPGTGLEFKEADASRYER
ncbi:MAG TPA: enolase C-terminal domain-like protein [Candidatus Baltobacteraceae bacterium]|nr:enolase C-terminal domain-like protein [Candidatus Baltobacteraceae bacterium]